jgi:hypothetical protein
MRFILAAAEPTMETGSVESVMRRFIPHLFVAIAALAGASARADEPWVDDVIQTIRIRQLLHEDEELRGLNLGVSVQNRVATLWGPVPKMDLGLRAESCLRGIPELRNVKNELYVQETLLRFAPAAGPRPVPGMPVDRPTPPAIPSVTRR